MLKPLIAFFLSFLYCLILPAQERNLEYFVSLARENAPELRDFRFRLESARIDSLRLRAELGVKVNVFSNNSYAPVIAGVGQDEAITNGANIYSALHVNRDIIGRKNLQNQLRSIDLQKRAIRDTAIISEQEIRKSVTEQFINAWNLQRQAETCLAELELMRREELLLKKLVADGIYRQTDFLSFRLLLNQQVLQYHDLSSLYRQAFRSLNYLCGVTDTAVIRVADPVLTLDKLPDPVNSVFYMPFITDSLTLATSDRQVDFNYKPKLNVFGETAFNSSFYDQPWRNFGPNFGLSLTIPIYDGHQRKMEHDQFSILEKTRIAYRDFFLKQYSQQVSQLYLRLKDNMNLHTAIAEQVGTVTALVEANRRLLEKGEASVTEYIMAMSNLLSIKNQLTQNETEKFQLVNQLNYWCREKK